MDDIRAIMDAVGSKRAAIMGESEGGPLAMLFAAAHPERAVALILQGGEVREQADDEWPYGENTRESFESSMATVSERWGQGRAIDLIAPSIAGQEWAYAWLGRMQTNAGTPGAIADFARMAFEIDVRHVAPSINVPTLVVHAVDDGVCHVENARFLARTIPGARYVELPGADHVPWFEPEHRAGGDPRAPHRSPGGGNRRSGARDRAVHRPRRLDCARRVGRRSPVARPARAAPRGGATRARALRRARGRHRRRRILRNVRRSRARDPLRRGDHRRGPPARPRGARGLHTGEVEVVDGKVAGIAVNIGARVAAQAVAGEVLVSGTVRDLVAGSGLAFDDRGGASLKGIPGEWRLFAVAGPF